MAASVVLITVSFENSLIEYSIENYSNPLDIEFALHCMVGLYRFLPELYDSEKMVGLVDRESFCFRLADPLFPYAGNSAHNQQRM